MLNAEKHQTQINVSSSSPRNKSVNINEQVTIMCFMTLQTKMESDTFIFNNIFSVVVRREQNTIKRQYTQWQE